MRVPNASVFVSQRNIGFRVIQVLVINLSQQDEGPNNSHLYSLFKTFTCLLKVT